ncbi:hypothetical protein ACS0PU_004229 [Formica fusca]
MLIDGQVKTGCREIAARRDTSSSICNMDAHVAPDPAEEIAAKEIQVPAFATWMHTLHLIPQKK